MINYEEFDCRSYPNGIDIDKLISTLQTIQKNAEINGYAKLRSPPTLVDYAVLTLK